MTPILFDLLAGPSSPLFAVVAAGATLAAPDLIQPSVESSATPLVATRLIDLDGNGTLDILSQDAQGSLSIRMHTGRRQFVDVPQDLPKARVTEALSTDLDGDGVLDLYLVTPEQDLALVGDGTGRFEDATERLGLSTSGHGISAERADLDGDGLEDLIVHNQASDVLFWAEVDGRFLREERTTEGVAPFAPTLRDATRDPRQPLHSPTTAGSSPMASGNSPSPSTSSSASTPTIPLTGGSSAAATTGPITDIFSVFVVDNADEVDSDDILDGSLTGADVSTTSEDVSHTNGMTRLSNPSAADPALFVEQGGAFIGDDSGQLPSSVGSGVRVFRDTSTGVAEVFHYDYGTDTAQDLAIQGPGGNLGVGTSSPLATLHVDGDTLVEGTVGIGTTTPTTDLDVEGTTSLSNMGDVPALAVEGSAFFGADSMGLNSSVGKGIRVFHDSKLDNGQIFAFDYGTGTPSDLILQFPGGKVGIGTATPATTLDIDGALTIRGGADIVERFDISGAKAEPGTVVVIDEERPGDLCASSRAYDRRVAGIVSGAGGVKPGICLGQEGVMDGETPVAMTGRVYVRASAENGAIRPGDRLTTAMLAGHAMRATDNERSVGAVIGKAMTSLDEGTGLVLVLVNLQ